MHEIEPLTLIPDLIPDPDRRRQRENERRIEEHMRRMIASLEAEQSSYARRFLTME